MFQTEPAGNPPVRFHPCLEEWRARIDMAERRGWFTQAEQALAWDWTCCAIGEAERKYGPIAMWPSNSSRIGPLDDRLRFLGVEFCSCVLTDRFNECRATLTAIEWRLEELAA